MNKKLLIAISILFTLKSQQIIVFSIPKCGTHLLAKSIELLTKKHLEKEILIKQFFDQGLPYSPSNSQFFRCHLPYNKNVEQQLISKGYKSFFIYRDPRDQVISQAFWTQKRLQRASKPCPSINELITYMINDLLYFYNIFPTDKTVMNIRQYYHEFLPWMRSPAACVIKFENLIGPKGGGNIQAQQQEIQKIYNYLGITNKSLINYTIANLFGNTMTFREGQIQQWRKYFTAEHKQMFKKHIGHLLIHLGYEKNLNW